MVAPPEGGIHVALLAEGVDRNKTHICASTAYNVALLAEGVDRNVVLDGDQEIGVQVALLAEGVDRNRRA